MRDRFDSDYGNIIVPPTPEEIKEQKKELKEVAQKDFDKKAEEIAKSPIKRMLHNTRMAIFFGDKNPEFEKRIEEKREETAKKMLDKK